MLSHRHAPADITAAATRASHLLEPNARNLATRPTDPMLARGAHFDKSTLIPLLLIPQVHFGWRLSSTIGGLRQAPDEIRY